MANNSIESYPMQRIPFTKEMKDNNYTVLVPNMLPIHFKMLVRIFRYYGYNAVLLTNEGHDVIEEGLKYVHNDTCYPALLVIGQMISALNSGKFDVNKTALMITQTGGGCRASNYIHLLRKALIKAGYGNIPVISLNLSGLEKDSGFSFTLPMIRKCIDALAYGDIIMLLKNQVRPYEAVAGTVDALVEKWAGEISDQLDAGKGCSIKEIRANMKQIAADFAAVETVERSCVKVGIVGEIYVKFASLANNNLEGFLAEQGCEVMVPGIMGFMLFKVDNRREDILLYGGSKAKKAVVELLLGYFEKIEAVMLECVGDYPKFAKPTPYQETKKLIDGVIGRGCKMGEGWLLTAEMLELIHHGYSNIVCAQPFGCLPNHIVGKGMIRRLKEIHPNSNIVPIDYDPGATKVNQENRIKLMLAVAREKMIPSPQKKDSQTIVHA